MDITCGIRAWYWNMMVLTRIQTNKPPPLDPEFEGVFVEEDEVEEEEVHPAETMTNKGYALQDDKNKEEYIKIMKHIFDEITKNMTQQLMKGFELLVSQFGSKGVIGGSSSSQSEEKKTMGEHIFTSTGPHNRPEEFHSTPRPNPPKFIKPK